jgi:hypothetical protein
VLQRGFSASVAGLAPCVCLSASCMLSSPFRPRRERGRAVCYNETLCYREMSLLHKSHILEYYKITEAQMSNTYEHHFRQKQALHTRTRHTRRQESLCSELQARTSLNKFCKAAFFSATEQHPCIFTSSFMPVHMAQLISGTREAKNSFERTAKKDNCSR